MTSFADAARTLRTVLQTENAALRQDPALAATMVAEKAAAADALAEAAHDAARTYYNQALAEQIRELATENAALLASAIAVQTRVIAIVTNAARTTEQRGHDSDRYDQKGAGIDRGQTAVALMHRA